MTAFNAEATIVQAVESILNQTLRNFRVIIVDDGSTDKTHALLTEMASRDARIVVLTQLNQGIVAAANRGLRMCEAEFVARLDADDIAFPLRLQSQLEFMTSSPDCVAVSCLVYHIDADGRRTGSVAGKLIGERVDARSIPAREPYIMHPFMFVRRSALHTVGGYRHVDFAEDSDLYWRLREVGRLQVIEQFLGEYRLHSSSVSSHSVVNARISATNSQLAAISAERRHRNMVDLEFAAGDVDQFRSREDLRGIFELVRPRLTGPEFDHFRLATAAKLLELNSYRPYELEQSDCEILSLVLGADRGKVVSGLPEVRRLWGIACARLLRKGHFRRAFSLFKPYVAIETLRSLLFQFAGSVLPVSLRVAIRRSKARRALRSGSI